MALQAKLIKTKIKSVSSIRKITKAMEMVSAAKMKRSVNRVVASRSYSNSAFELLKEIATAGAGDISHPLMSAQKGDRALCLAISSNRGLCGGYNSQIGKAILEFAEENTKEKSSFITVGKRAEKFARKTGGEVLASFTNISDIVTNREIWSMTRMIFDEFNTGKYSKVVLLFTDWKSALSYKTAFKTILPVHPETLFGNDYKKPEAKEKVEVVDVSNSIFEPSIKNVLDFILPRIIEVQIYQSILESQASEHSARMVAMKNATENAKKFIEELSLGYNQARQAMITQEISEIASGAMAMAE